MKDTKYPSTSAAPFQTGAGQEDAVTERERRVTEERKRRRAARRKKFVVAALLTVLIAESAAALGFFFTRRFQTTGENIPILNELPFKNMSLENIPVLKNLENIPFQENLKKIPFMSGFFAKAPNMEESDAGETESTAKPDTDVEEYKNTADAEETEDGLSADPLATVTEPQFAENLTDPPPTPAPTNTPAPSPTPAFALWESRNTIRLYPPVNTADAATESADGTTPEDTPPDGETANADQPPVQTDVSPESKYIVLIDADTGEIIAARDSWQIVPPASMTKVLTLLVAAEHLGSLDRLNDLVGVTKEVTNYCYVHDCSVAGFSAWETVTVRDLLYGLILPSGADAALALSRYIAGSHETFVELMNEKLEELGIAETAHFTNCIGLYDPNHACTVKDIAVIMHAAMRDPVCKAVLRARTYRTSSTDEHPNGILLSNLFLRRIEDRFADSDLYINGGKTGFVNQSGSCAVSSAARDDGRKFICVTANAPGSWRVIYDHTLIYQTLLP